jgi:hypothetical protein
MVEDQQRMEKNCNRMSEEKKTLLEQVSELSETWNEQADQYESACNQFWDALPYDDKLMAFYSVCKRIHKGDIIDNGSYRYVLYEIFGFEPDAYMIGMECNYMEIHNSIVTDKDQNDRKNNSESSDI